MRCVLPHLENPWHLIEQILSANSKAKIYIEFQNLDYILENKLWYSLFHDHVNLFRMVDFQKRFNIIEFGYFLKGEWAYVLLSAAERKDLRMKYDEISVYVSQFDNLFERMSQEIDQLVKLNKPILIYGAGGKGITFSYALKSNGSRELLCLDADITKQGSYLECSGVEVISPKTALENFTPDTLILVLNKNYLESAKKVLNHRKLIFTISDYINESGGFNHEF